MSLSKQQSDQVKNAARQIAKDFKKSANKTLQPLIDALKNLKKQKRHN